MQFEIFGVKELDDFFNTMKNTDQKRIIMGAFQIGAKPIIDTAKSNLKARIKRKSKTSNLTKSIGFVAGKGKTIITAKVGARKYRPYKGYHGHLFDAGTTTRATKKGANRGAMPARHFFTEAVETQADRATKEMENNLLQSIEKFIDRGLKRQAKLNL